MLELQRWLFKLRNPRLGETRWPRWEVFDPYVQRQVGVVPPKQLAMTVKEFFRFRWLNLPDEVRAVPDDSLVFSTVTQVRLGRPRLQTRNARGELVGYFQRKRFSINGGYWVYDSQGCPLGEVRADWSQYDFRFVAPDGQELGKVSRKLVGLSRAFLHQERDYLVTASDAIADQLDTKRMLLATALAVCELR